MQPEPWSARYLRGFTYVDRGRDFRRRRLDCWGFAMLIAREVFGLELPSFLNLYETVHERAQTASACLRGRLAFERVTVAHPGDLALIRLIESPTHVGIVCGPDALIHLSRPGVRVQSIARTSPLGRRVEGFYRCATA